MSQNYVYKNSDGVFTTGFYDPAGQWQPEHDCSIADEAAARCAWLNGGARPTLPTSGIGAISFADGVAKIKDRWPDRYFTIETSFSRLSSGEEVRSYSARVSNPEGESGFCRYGSNLESFSAAVSILLTEKDAPKMTESLLEGTI